MKFDRLVESIKKNLSAGMSAQDIADKHSVPVEDIEKEIAKGIPGEQKEHGLSEEEARSVAMDHLVETPRYYSTIAETDLE